MRIPQRPTPTFRVEQEDGYVVLIASLYGLEVSKHIHAANLASALRRGRRSQEQVERDIEHWKRDLAHRLEEMHLEQLIKQTGGQDGETED